MWVTDRNGESQGDGLLNDRLDGVEAVEFWFGLDPILEHGCSARNRLTRMNPDGSCGRGLASLALAENAMIA